MRLTWMIVVVAVLAVLLCGATPAAASEGQAVLQLRDDNFDHVIKDNEVVLVNFYADWCRFSKMLEGPYEQAAKLLGDSVDARIARLNCEDPQAQKKKQENHITKYPTIKVFRHGKPLRQEYRGQRSAVAIEKFVRELLANPILEATNADEVKEHLTRHRKAVVGHFSSRDHSAFPVFAQLGNEMRDDCHFIAHIGSSAAGDKGARATFRTLADEHVFDGELSDVARFKQWATNECTPMVREITFENGEELTEEGIPFIILFYDPTDLHPVQQFSRYVRAHLEHYRGYVNFITADGHKFSHPLQHLGKSKKDLPVLAADTFRHMYLFKNFKRIHRDGVLQKFIDDVLSGKLHQALHNPNLAGKAAQDPYAEEYDEYDDEPEPDMDSRKDTIKDKMEDAEDLKEESKKAAKAIRAAETASKRNAAEAAAKRLAESGGDADAAEVGAADDEAEDNEHHVPVPVKSVLNRLKPSSDRYSMVRNHEEL